MKNKSLAAIALLALLALLLGCAPKKAEPGAVTATITLAFQEGSGRQAARPFGTVNDIVAITLDVNAAATSYALSLPLTYAAGVWSCEVPSLPVGPSVTFTAHAFNSSAVEIFSGTANQVLTVEGPNNVSITMAAVDIGLPIVLPGIGSITKPYEILVNGSVSVEVDIRGGLNDTLTYLVTPASGGGAFTGASGQVDLTGTSILKTFTYTAPALPGTYTHTVRVTNSNGDFIETTFNTYVVANYSTKANLSVTFVPVINSLMARRNGSNLTFQAVVVDDGAPSEIACLWSFSGGLSFDDPTANPTTLLGFDETVYGTLTLVATDGNGSGHTSVLNYNLPAGQFPDSLTIKTLDLTVNGNGQGVVRGDFIATAASVSQQYDHGTPLILVAIPDPGSTFIGWGGACAGTGACVFTMNVDTQVTATFEPN